MQKRGIFGWVCRWLSIQTRTAAAVASQAYTANGFYVIESVGEAHLDDLARHGFQGFWGV